MKVEISESQLNKAIQYYRHYIKDQETSSDMLRALELGQVYKAADLHPFYIYDQVTNSIIVTSKENMDKKLH